MRKDWARYADMVTLVDAELAEILSALDADGLAQNTIVFIYSDHGHGMSRSKRWLMTIAFASRCSFAFLKNTNILPCSRRRC